MHRDPSLKRQYYLLANLPQISSRSGRNHTNGCRGIRLAQINYQCPSIRESDALSPADCPSRPLLVVELDGWMVRDSPSPFEGSNVRVFTKLGIRIIYVVKELKRENKILFICHLGLASEEVLLLFAVGYHLLGLIRLFCYRHNMLPYPLPQTKCHMPAPVWLPDLFPFCHHGPNLVNTKRTRQIKDPMPATEADDHPTSTPSKNGPTALRRTHSHEPPTQNHRL